VAERDAKVAELKDEVKKSKLVISKSREEVQKAEDEGKQLTKELKLLEEEATKAHQVSISSTIYQQLLPKKIPNAQKDSQVISDFLRFWHRRM